jgi:hypothetical protein
MHNIKDVWCKNAYDHIAIIIHCRSYLQLGLHPVAFFNVFERGLIFFTTFQQKKPYIFVLYKLYGLNDTFKKINQENDVLKSLF